MEWGGAAAEEHWPAGGCKSSEAAQTLRNALVARLRRCGACLPLVSKGRSALAARGPAFPFQVAFQPSHSVSSLHPALGMPPVGLRYAQLAAPPPCPSSRDRSPRIQIARASQAMICNISDTSRNRYIGLVHGSQAHSHRHSTSTASTPAAVFKKSTSFAGNRKLHTPPLSAVDSKLGIAHTTPSASCKNPMDT